MSRTLDPPSVESESAGAMTSVEHWNAGWTAIPSGRFWSPFDPSTSDLYHLLARAIPLGGSVLEVGFSPGKILAWAALKRQAKVAGIDYSPQGVGITKAYFDILGLEGDLRCEDVLETTFARGSFDCVFSIGLVEHFTDPRPIVAKHVELAKPGGRIIIVIPNYGGVYGKMQGSLEPENLAIHNLDIMSPEAMRSLFDPSEVSDLRTFRYGRPSLSGVALHRAMPAAVAHAIQKMVGLTAHFVPRPLSPAKPMICAVAEKR